MDLRRRNLIDIATHHADATADKNVFLILNDDGEPAASLTFAQLDEKARNLAMQLLCTVAAGDRMLLALPDAADFIVALYACFYAGAVAVPVSPDIRHRQARDKIRRIARQTDAALVLSEGTSALALAKALPDATVLDVSTISNNAAAVEWTAPVRGGSDPALIQYTSGSTGRPKGVVISHANLLHNLALMKDGFRQSAESVFVGWLPLFHDQGLMSNVLLAHYLGGSSVLMSPASFIAKPCRWLQAISRYRGTTGGGPNFAYDLCVDRISDEEQSGFELTSWTVAFNGAEPVRARTLNRFATRFEASGFRRAAICPAYGMAETTLVLTGNAPTRAPVIRLLDQDALQRNKAITPLPHQQRSVAIVGCGRVLSDQRVRIVDTHTGLPCDDGCVGEIWARGGSVTAGYWREAQQSPALADDECGQLDGENYLRTGDLGFFCQGELFLTGRTKDLIIIRGQNLYPHDIERAVDAAHRSIRKGCVAAFGVARQESEPEQLVLVFELRSGLTTSDDDELWGAVNSAVFSFCRVAVSAIVALPAGQLPKTSSGKVRRRACRQAYLDGDYRRFLVTRPAADRAEDAAFVSEGETTQIVQWLRTTVARLQHAQVESISARQPLNRLGLDSVTLLQLLRGIARQYDVQLQFDPLLDAITLIELARRVATASRCAQTTDSADNDAPDTPGLATRREFMLWVQSQAAADSSALNLARCFTIRRADTQRLASALVSAIALTPALCRTYQLIAGRLTVSQETDAAAAVTICQTGDDASSIEAQLHHSFDLARELPIRVKLFASAHARDVTVLVVAHHIALDLWSMPVFLERVHAFYTGQATTAPTLVASRDKIAAAAYWRSMLKLADATAGGALKPTASGPTAADAAVRREHFRMSKSASQQLRRFARNVGVTPFTVVITAYALLLQRYSADAQIVIGSPVNVRSTAGPDDQVGFGVELVPLIVEMHAGQSVFELLQLVRSRVLNAQQFAHGYSESFEPDAKPLRIANSLSWQQLPEQHSALLPLVLGDEATEFCFGDWSIKSRPLPPVAGEYALALFLCDSGTGISGHLIAPGSLHSETFIAELTRQLHSVLLQLLADPNRRIAQIRLDAPRAQTTPAPASGAISAGEFVSIVDLIEQQAARDGNATAVVELATHGDGLKVAGNLTYGELSERSRALAANLNQRFASGPGQRIVAVLAERSADRIVALLAVLQAGAAYLPLETQAPAARWSAIARQAGVDMLLCSQAYQLSAEKLFANTVVINSQTVSDSPAPACRVRGNDLAYVMHTSGSSGTPKGVMIEHGAISSHLKWMQNFFAVNGQDVVLQKTRYTFDVSVWEQFLPLMAGARLLLLPHGRDADPALLRAAIEQFSVSIAHFVPTMLGAFVSACGTLRADQLRLLLCSGEALPLATCKSTFDCVPAHTRLFNLYGPTEATIDVTAAEVMRDDSRITIGRSIDGSHVHIVDADLNPLPAWAAGQLCLAGNQLARGYIRAPALTAGQFVPAALPAASRLYLTGDLARWTGDGRIEYLGRMDDQLKINGQRIEPMEISAALLHHPQIGEAVTIGASDPSGHLILASFYVKKAGDAPTDEAVRAHLTTLLPSHLVPHRLTRLDAMPVSPAGKVDRGALLKALATPPERPLRQPRDAMEQKVLLAFQQVIHNMPMGVTDNFFAVGGDSILSVRAIAHLQSQGLEASVDEIFRFPTARSLASQLSVKARSAGTAAEAGGGAPSWDARVQLPPGVSAVYPMPSLLRALVYEKNHNDNYEIYLTSLEINAPYRHDLLQLAIDRCVARHAFLRIRFDLDGYPEPALLVQAQAAIKLAESDLSALAPDAQCEYLQDWNRRERKQAFEFTRAPLFRFSVHVLSSHSFQFSLSEIALDGWCVATLLTEIFADYSSLLKGLPPLRRPALIISYRDFVALEREAAGSREQKAFWQQRLKNLPLNQLPNWHGKDSAGPANLLQARQDIWIEDSHYHALRNLARQQALPLRTLLLAAHFKVLSAIYRNDDIVTGLELNGRPETADGDKLVGVFNNMVPLRVRLRKGSWLSLMAQVHDSEQQALPFRRYPYARHFLDCGRQHPFDVMFVFSHFHLYRELLNLDNIGCRSAYATDQTFFPLTVHFDHDMLAGRLRLILDHDPSRVSADQVKVYAGFFARVLGEIANSPKTSHAALSLLSSLPAFPPPVAERVDMRSLPARLAATAARVPAAIAASGNDGTSISYASLSMLAARVAAGLVQRGVQRNDVIAVDLPRSIEAFVTILGVMQASASYLPVAGNLPVERKRRILRQSRAALLVSNENAAWAEQTCVAAVCTGAALAATEMPAGRSAPVDADCEGHILYLIHTSGSTGEPKSVQIFHNGILNLLGYFIRAFQLSERDSFMLITSLNFDLTQKNLFLPLLLGTTLHIYDKPYFDPARIASEIAARRPTVLNCTPSMFTSILEQCDAGYDELRSLRMVFLGGEPLVTEPLLGWLNGASCHATVVNTYGPAECTDVCTTFTLTSDTLARPSAPVGKAIANTSVFILDSSLIPVPPGVTGEICIAGTSVGKGYVDTGRNRGRFVQHPLFSNSLVYRTGDLGIELPDGNLDCLGRIDDQIKINGVRVEPAEVCSLIKQFSQVSDAFVFGITVDGRQRLAACLVPAGKPAIDIDRLRHGLRQLLPEYMLPARYLVVDSLPLSDNGKIDLRALQKRLLTETRAPVRSRQPLLTDPLMETLRSVWQSVLGSENADPNLRYFEAGGDSISSISFVAQARRAGLQVETRWLMESPTLAELAATMTASRQATRGPEPKPAAGSPGLAASEDTPLVVPLTALQTGMLFDVLGNPGHNLYVCVVSCLVRGDLDIDLFKLAWQRVMMQYAALRSWIDWRQGDKPARRIEHSVALPFSWYDASDDPHGAEAAADAIVQSEQGRQFDLKRAPLMHLSLVRLSDRSYRVIWSHHHIILDGWSELLVLGDVLNVYACYRAGTLPELHTEASAPAIGLENAPMSSTQTQFWRDYLADFQGARSPLNAGDGLLQSASGSLQQCRLSCTNGHRLARFAQVSGLTQSSIFLSLWALAMSASTSQDDVLFGVTASGRTSSQLHNADRQVGLLISTLPMRIRFTGDTSVLQWLAGNEANKNRLSDYEGQSLGAIQSAAGRQHRGARLFESIVVIENLPDFLSPRIEASGLQVSKVHGYVDEGLPVVLVVEPGAEATLTLKYRSGLLQPSEANDLLLLMDKALGSLVSDPATLERDLGEWRHEQREALAKLRLARRRDNNASLFGRPG